MPASDAVLYKAHVKNLRAVEDGLSHVTRDLNRAISQQDARLSDTLKKLHIFLAGAWAECRLKKLLYEPNGLSPDMRREVLGKRSQAERWRHALELGYRKRYVVRRAPISEATVGGTALFRYVALQSLISVDLEPLIGLRNTLAHGQWSRPLNSEESEISGDLIRDISAENALSVKLKLLLVSGIADLIHDLVAATSFERDFDLHYKKVVSTRTSLQTRSYVDWERHMIEKLARGRQKRDLAIKFGD